MWRALADEGGAPTHEEWFSNLAHAWAVIENWRAHDNTRRLHSTLGYRPLSAYLATRAASLERPMGSTQLPFCSMIKTGDSQPT